MKKLVGILIVLIFFGASLPTIAQSGKLFSFKASMDSAVILMGNKTAIHLEVIGDIDGSGSFLYADSAWKDVELSGEEEPRVTDLGNNRKELKKDIIVQAFDSGLYALPPMVYAQGGDTIYSNPLSLKVVPVNVDTLKTIHDYDGVVTPGRKFFDFLPDWMTDYGLWILLGLLVVGASVWLYILFNKKGRIPFIPQKKMLSPYELAIKSLEMLRGKKLCESGHEKEFYTELTDILRNYLNGRFGISAMEMTSSQIMDSLSGNAETKNSKDLMDKILQMADFVKFAKVRPLPDDNVVAFRNALKFVEETKPQPVEHDENAENDSATQH